MNKEDSNLFGVYVDRVNSGIFEFANKSEYSLLPIVSIVRNDDIPVIVRTNKPMKLFKKGTSYSFIKGMLRNENNSVLSIPWMAFRDIQEIAREKSNKVLADLVAAIIVEKSKECIEKNEKSKSIFFIESTDSRKIIGRLGNIFRPPKNNCCLFDI